MCETESQWEVAVQCRELSLAHCDNLEWDGVGGGREVQEGGDIYITQS